MSVQIPPASAPGPQPAAASTSTMAIISLVAGILGLSLLPLVGSIIAVITGPIAKREHRRLGRRPDGRGPGYGRGDPGLGRHRLERDRVVHHRRRRRLAAVPGAQHLQLTGFVVHDPAGNVGLIGLY